MGWSLLSNQGLPEGGQGLALSDHIWGSAKEQAESRSHMFPVTSKGRDRMDEECAAWGRKGCQMCLPG